MPQKYFFRHIKVEQFSAVNLKYYIGYFKRFRVRERKDPIFPLEIEKRSVHIAISQNLRPSLRGPSGKFDWSKFK